MTILWAALSLGAVYAIVALTLNLPLSQAGVFNLAQTQLIVVGLFITYTGVVTLGLPAWLVMIGAAVLVGLLALIEDLVAIRPLGSDSHHGSLVTTIGFLVVLEGLVLVFWGPRPRSVPFFIDDVSFSFAGGRIAPSDIAVILIAVGLGLVLHFGSSRTRLGLQGRAATEDIDAAKLRGINVTLVRTGSLVAAGALGGALGIFLAPLVGVSVEMSFKLLIFGFVSLVVGGTGSYLGALLGGFIIGLAELFTGRVLGAEWTNILVFVLLLVVLLALPKGILGRKDVRTV